MAVSGRVLGGRDRAPHRVAARGLSLILVVVALTRLAPAAPRQALDQRILAHKQAQVRRLQEMLSAVEGRSQRHDLLFRLAELELELAILKADARAADADLEAPTVTCRRLLVEAPDHGRADQVRLFLARLELRRGQAAAAVDVLGDLERLHPRSGLLCQARLLKGAAWLAQKERARAEQVFRQVLGMRCAASVRHQARYQLAWTLLAQQQAGPAARELRGLCLERGLKPALRERALKDLTLAWAIGAPDEDAGPFLLRQAPTRQMAARLIRDLGERLLEDGKLDALLALSADLLRTTTEPATAEALVALRLRALARHGSTAAFEQELARLERRRLALSVREVVARSLAEQARRQAGTADARRLYQRLVRSYGETPEARSAHYHLGELLLQAGELERAASHFEGASRAADSDLAARASYHALHCLERLLERAKPGARSGLLARFARAAAGYVAKHPRRPEAAMVLVAAGSRLAGEAGQEQQAVELLTRFLREHPGHAERRRATLHLLVALERSGQHARCHALAQQELAGCGAEADCRELRRTASRTALAQSRKLAGQGRWGEAHRWALRAVGVDPRMDRAARTRILLAAAGLATRAGQPEEADRILVRLADEATVAGPEQRPILEQLARQQQARGQLSKAAASYLRLAQGATRPDQQLGSLHEAARAQQLAGQGALAISTVRRMQRAAARLPAARQARWQLRIGSLLEGMDRRKAYGHYFGQAQALWRHDGQAAATCLVRAAGLAPSERRAETLYQQAIVQAGALRRGGRVSAPAVEARLGLARLMRRKASPDLARRVVALQELAGVLSGVMRLGDPRWSAAAGVELAAIYGELAATLQRSRVPTELAPDRRARYQEELARQVAELRQIRGQLLGRLAALARRPGGLDRHTLEAAQERLAVDPQLVRADHQPPASFQVDPALALLRAGRHQAAARVATAALEVYGARPDLLCARGVARVASGQPKRAQRDWEEAARLEPESRCARGNLAALALWRGDPSAARELLRGQKSYSALVGLAVALAGLGDFDGAARTARRALERGRAEGRGTDDAVFLLGTLLVDHLGRPKEAMPLLRRCIGGNLPLRARQRLQRLVHATGGPS